MYYPEETSINPMTQIWRDRLLPTRGKVLVRAGEVVGPADVVARCLVPGDIHVVDVCRTLRVREERLAKVLRKTVGDTVQKDEVIAAPSGLLGRLGRQARSPIDGQVIAIRQGRVVIEATANSYELRAHFGGKISNVMPNLGVVLSLSGALVQGLWGNGKESEGILKVLVDSPQKPLRTRTIDVSCHGTILVGGRIADEEVIDHAAEAQVRGIVVGSVHADLCSVLQEAPFPVLVTEGFGKQAMSSQAFSLLRDNTGREAMLSTEVQTRWGAKRPEILIPLRDEGDTQPTDTSPQPLRIGDPIRIVREPNSGAIGKVVDLPERPAVLDSGARFEVALVDIGHEEPVAVPVDNLEVIH